jgi:protein-tyrosine phosphatase
MIDIHSHILPNLDDGAINLAQALQLCRMAERDRVKTMVATPHMLNDQFSFGLETIFLRFAELTSFLKKAKINLEVLLGAEIHLALNLRQKITRREVLTLNETGRYILLELPFQRIPPQTKEVIFDLKLNQITPIIAHPERIAEVQEDPNKLYDFISLGALSQITASSLTGRFGSKAKKCAIRLIEQNLTHIIASDAHSPDSRPPGLTEAVRIASKIIGQEAAQNMVTILPQKILKGEPLDHLPEPIQSKSNSFWFFLK